MLKCEHCGNEHLDSKNYTVPDGWGEVEGHLVVTKFKDITFYTCPNCHHTQGHPDPQSLATK